MSQVLCVEDNITIGASVKRAIEAKLGFEVYWLKTYQDAKGLLAKHSPL